MLLLVGYPCQICMNRSVYIWLMRFSYHACVVCVWIQIWCVQLWWLQILFCCTHAYDVHWGVVRWSWGGGSPSVNYSSRGDNETSSTCVLKRLFIVVFLWRWGGAFGRLHFVAAKAMLHGLGFEVPLLWSMMCQGGVIGGLLFVVAMAMIPFS
jgi:hypothetical protein